nr:hypothetical protein [Candidatus Bathyarchaeota archaeon]
MLFFADLHIHSKYSRATSSSMDLPILYSFAKVKGLNLLGTGDFSHPKWLKEVKEQLEQINDSGFYVLKGKGDVYFLLTNEVSTNFQFEKETKKIHHLLIVESFDVVDQVNEAISKYGDLKSDGRPVLNCTPAELVETIMELDRNILIVPAHIWTSWFGAL